jgi:predicted Zn finger-like uncharacterized protein
MAMIIECKQCESKFNLDEGLLREEGSKVRCSVCKSVFRAYPPGLAPSAEVNRTVVDQNLGRTVTLDSPPAFKEKSPGPLLEDASAAGLAEALQEGAEMKRAEALSPEQIPEEEEELRFDFEEDVERGPEGDRVRSTEARETAERKPEASQQAEKTSQKRKRRGGLTGVLMTVLIIVLLLTGAGAALFYFAPEYIPEPLTSYLGVAGKPEVKDPGVRRLSFKAVSGKFHASNKAGNLFCIQGMVFNNYPGSRSFIRVKGSLLDEKGAAVKQKLAFAGNTFSENELKDLSLEQINQSLSNRTGKGNINVNVKPQASVPFMIVFEELPENLSEFTVEAVSSAPGQ